MVFYRKYRPQKLSELVGQEEIAKTLLSQLETGKVGQGYLFWGPKGTGKTSTARILAKAVNCEVYRKSTIDNRGASKAKGDKQSTIVKFGEPCGKCESCRAIADGSFIDLIEIDATSNRGIDEVRDLREKVKLAPAVGRFKVYIIDEVHMLTTEAFNALLKTLEEPPKHVIFILATTEYAKLPATITSRLMKFHFKRASVASLVKSISMVAKTEGIEIDPRAALTVAQSSEGSFRDALSILDQMSASGREISEEDVRALVRIGSGERVTKFLELVSDRKLKEAVMSVDELPAMGFDVSLFVRQVVLIAQKLLYIKIGIGADDLDLAEADLDAIAALSEKFSLADVKKLLSLFMAAEGEIPTYPIAHIPVVLAVCKFCDDPGQQETRSSLSEARDEIPTEDSGLPGIKKSSESIVPPKNKISLGEVEKNWEEFLNRVRPVNAHVFALLRSTKPASYDGDSVTLEVFYRFHKDKLEEPKIIKMLDNKWEEILGKKVKLKFTLARRESMPTAAVDASDVVEGSADELEKLAHEIFSK